MLVLVRLTLFNSLIAIVLLLSTILLSTMTTHAHMPEEIFLDAPYIGVACIIPDDYRNDSLQQDCFKTARHHMQHIFPNRNDYKEYATIDALPKHHDHDTKQHQYRLILVVIMNITNDILTNDYYFIRHGYPPDSYPLSLSTTIDNTNTISQVFAHNIQKYIDKRFSFH